MIMKVDHGREQILEALSQSYQVAGSMAELI
jgi:hypothetical protein